MVRRTVISLLSIFIFVVAATLVQGAVGTGLCVDFFNVEDTACGITVDSDFGNGAVELCQDCFACGFADDICPEDFGSNCTGCSDPDCLVTINGTVFNPTGNILINAEVVARFDHIVTPYVAITDDIGFYQFQVPTGIYNLRVRHDDYPYQEVPFPIEQMPGPFIQNITMSTASCTPACTSWTETGMKCQTICRGDNGCNPLTASPWYANDTSNSITADLLEKCENESADTTTTVYLGAVDSETQLWGQCCSGPVYTTNWLQSIEPMTNATDVTQKTIPATYKGTGLTIPGVRVHIITYND